MLGHSEIDGRQRHPDLIQVAPTIYQTRIDPAAEGRRMTRKPIRVLIVDDSASVRQVLSSILSEDTDIEVMGDSEPIRSAARRLAERDCPTS